VMGSVNPNTNLVMGRVQMVTLIVMENVEIKGTGQFVMGNVNPYGMLVMENVLRVT